MPYHVEAATILTIACGGIPNLFETALSIKVTVPPCINESQKSETGSLGGHVRGSTVEKVRNSQ